MSKYAYLLGQTDLFRNLLGEDILRDLELEKVAAQKKTQKRGSRRHRKTEAEEDVELITNEAQEHPRFVFTESPSFVTGGTMRDYQVQGLNWMISLYENGVNGILADEMGLGKTLQTISFLGYLRFCRNISGPHLIVVPKSTLQNWCNEFAMWIPDFKVVLFHGEKEKRATMIQESINPVDFDICVTSYEMCLMETAALRKISWKYIIIDEAHRIKNENSSLSIIVRKLSSDNRLLITGTPLQNNLHELWALLNFLLPEVFGTAEDFHASFGDGQEKVEQLHRVLRPFLLRRIKSDVEKSLLPKKKVNLYVGMSGMQKKWYQKILEKNIDAINGAIPNGRQSKTRLMNIVMQLRKCCNHPYLFEGAEPGPPYTTDQHLVENAGKMAVLDPLLRRLKENGSRVLLFSQMSRVLDILEDYCFWKEFRYCRIDGNTSHEDRIASLEEYNRPGSEKFIFLLTTRAGGLGINLTTADIVIMYDSDWNPQVDLQAEDRAHRIGQTKQVVVYRFITENAIEEKVIERATQKLFLDKMVIQQANTSLKTLAEKESATDYLTMIRHGAEAIFATSDGSACAASSINIDDILRRGEEKTAELSAKYENAKIDELFNYNQSAYEWDGEDYRKRQVGDNWGKLNHVWIGPAKRERRQLFNVPTEIVKTKSVEQQRLTKRISRVKQPQFLDFQFYPPRYVELQHKKYYWVLKEDGALPEGADDVERGKVDSAEPLTEEESAEMNALAAHGFADWTRRDFVSFLRGSERHGRTCYDKISQEMENKAPEDVCQYANVFWERFMELADWEKKIADIEKGELRNRRQLETERKLISQIAEYECPLVQLRLPYSQKTRSKQYTESEDRFLLVSLARHGMFASDVYEKIQHEIRTAHQYQFNWYFLSRTTAELSRRTATLLTMLQGDGRSTPISMLRESAAAGPPNLSSGSHDEEGFSSSAIPPSLSTSTSALPQSPN